MFEIKKLSDKAIPGALEKAMRYRLLNEPREAESICLDIFSVARAREILPRLHEEYDRIYYAGIICERQAKAALRRSTPHSRFIAYDNLREAMNLYEKAEKIHPEKNEDAILRWNACARMIMMNKLEEHTAEREIGDFLE
jgi:hypothetical protein